MSELTEKELIALIRSTQPEDKAALATFLDTAPTIVANNLLHDIAAAKAPPRMTVKAWFMVAYIVLTPFFAVLQGLRNWHQGKSWWDILFNQGTMHILLITSVFISVWEKVRQYRDTEEALLLLSARGDSRALPLLFRYWQVKPAPAKQAWNDRVEAEATRLLDENQSRIIWLKWKTVQEVVTQIMQIGRKPSRNEPRDITPEQAYLAMAILRTLARADGTEKGQLLKTVSKLPADAARFPNRAAVIEAAHIYYGAPDAAAPATAPLTVTNQTASPLQTLRRP